MVISDADFEQHRKSYTWQRIWITNITIVYGSRLRLNKTIKICDQLKIIINTKLYHNHRNHLQNLTEGQVLYHSRVYSSRLPIQT